ncbi:MAG: response regulator [Pseudomonadota bacterium]
MDRRSINGVDIEERRSGGVIAVLVLAIVFIGIAIAFAILPPEQSRPMVFGVLGLLAVFGVFSLFATAVGILRFGRDKQKTDYSETIAATADAAIAVVDDNDRVQWANGPYLKLSEADEITHAPVPAKLYAENPDVAEATYRLVRASKDRRSHMEEVRIQHQAKPDQSRWLRMQTWPLPAEDKGRRSVRRAVWQITDITADRDRQETVFQELQHAIDFLDHAPAGFFSSGADGEILYMNATLAGWLDVELADTTTGQIGLKQIVAGDGAALLLSVTPMHGEVRTEIHDVDFVQRSGTVFPVRVLHRVSFAADGTPGASRSLVLNRSHGEDISEDLRAAEVRFARFFNSAPIAIATASSDGTISRSNAAFARQFAIERTGRDGGIVSLNDIVVEDDQAALEAAISAAAGQKDRASPIEVTFAGESKRTGQIFVASVSDADTNKDALIGFIIDTTEQRGLEARVAHSQKMNAVGQLAGGIAHDFNNVLTAIIGFSDLLLADHKPGDPPFQDIMNIKQNANRAAGLVRQLLAFSRRQTMRPQVLDLSETITDLAMLLRRLLGETVTLKIDHGKDVWPIKADLSQLEQVLVNLTVNARDAMPNGGQLTLRTANIQADELPEDGEIDMKRTDYVLIEITDTGTGMPPEVMEKIFEPFFSTKEVGKGTGLGLATVYGIVKQTDGYIMPSSAVGQGTTFSIYLPRHELAEGEAPKKAETKIQPADLTGHGKILLVEDEDAVRAFSARALKSRGYDVYEADSGLSALDVMDEIDGGVDLVVSDVVMPEMDGPTLLTELRKTNPDLKIIFVSGYAEEAFRKNLPEGEKFVFLPKPFSLKQLAKAVKETMDEAV